MSKSKILVTGATGNIGYYVAHALADKGERVKIAFFQTDKAGDRFKNIKVEPVKFDFLDPFTFDGALDHVKKVFLIRPPQLANPTKDMKPFLTMAKEKGVEHIVFVSLMGVEKNPIVPHRKIENLIRESGINHTFLRPSFFMQNLNTTHLEDIALRNELYMPVGKAKTSFIDTRDIADVAAVCLTENGHCNNAYTLTGAKALDYHEIAEILSKTLGRKIEYKNPSILVFRKTLIHRGIKKEFANIMTMLYVITRFGSAKKITDDVKKILKREPISFEQYAIDFQNAWNK
ncbi:MULTISPECIES: SDR family oxidoreductase [Bacillus]|uniref:SDR family oxidoreductase n=1 Tax=Bacillus TaxID=1386 RepID=UPI000BB6ADD1|nr:MULTISPECIES: SDR family oxidoreductase [Bacillus]